MGGKTSTISNSEQKLGTLRVQTSMYGLAVRLMWGQPRVTGNLVWFGNFKAVAHTTTEQQGGKGGGGVRQMNTTYAYYAAAIMALGRGPVAGIASAWKGKQRYGGVTVSGAVSTLSYRGTIPVGGGTITVPLVGVTFKAAVIVQIDDYYTYSAGDNGP